MASFRITPLTDHTAAEVVGIDFTKPVDPDTQSTLNDAWAKYHVLVMREQKFTPDDFKRAATVFGELLPHHNKDHRVPGHPDVAYVSNDIVRNGKRFIPGETYHTDHSNHPAPPKATMLYPVALPSRGGDTQYVNMHAAYDDLDEAMKRRIDPLRARHMYQSKFSPRDLSPLSEASVTALPPPSLHPLVRVHPENRRKALYLNPVRIEAIDGMDEGEALALVGELMQHATQKQYEYRHQWRQGDWVIWDNRSVMHQANADYDMNERRYLYRLMLQGEVPIPAA
ncbi:MAG: TauD/TfdA family dioxygenase [Acetobacteraceae bacterium]|jgi:taurine dioxygenase